MGIAAAMCSTFSFNPIGISYFAAVYMENEEKIWIFPIVFLTLAFTMPFSQPPAVAFVLLGQTLCGWRSWYYVLLFIAGCR